MTEAADALRVSSAESLRLAEVAALGDAGAVGVAPLVDLLVDPSWMVRRGVVAALAHIGEPAIATLLASLTHDRTSETRVAATVDALSALGGDVDGAMIELSERADDPAVLCDVAQILGRRKSEAAVPALARLCGHADDNVAVAAIEALGRIGTLDAVQPLVAAVQSRNFFRTFPAITVLGRWADPRVIAPLADLLAEPSYTAEAAFALARTGLASAMPPLRGLLADADDAVVRVGAQAFVALVKRYEERIGDAAPILRALRVSIANRAVAARAVEALEGANEGEAADLCAVLGFTGDESAVAVLLARLDGPTLVAEAAAAALRAAESTTDARLREALRDGASARRLRLLPIVAERRTSVPELLACLDDDDGTVRALACDALARIGDGTVASRLFGLIGDVDVRVAQAAQAAIQSLGGASVLPLSLAAARSPDARVRRAGIRIVSYFGFAEALSVVLDAMNDTDARIRDAAIYGLPFIDDPRALDALVAACADAMPRTRAAALRALGQTGSTPRIVATLRAALTDDDPWARYYACQSAGKLGAVELTSDLIPRVVDDAGQVRVSAVEALARIGGEGAFEALCNAAKSTDDDLRRAALLGLGSTKRLESLPILRAALGDESTATRLIALGALEALDVPERAAAIAHATSDADENVRTAAYAALGTLPGRDVARALVARLDDANDGDRALSALSRADVGRVDAIVEALATASSALADRLVSALTRMRDPKSNAALEALLELDNVSARRAAARALTVLGTESARGALLRAEGSDGDDDVRRIAAAARS